ncbi:MAG: tRNA (adenosine(37)-N6)-threonylcarbamoyltransferase complex dimerization subunit type 1 TsaB [Pseudomonadales bacterium]|nr:tRNA (adenosine(37)-N6)-threonylcarbamoyltransferase complex dimerization subunit type 1 TsaB [Pseudomonadales bacterium]
MPNILALECASDSCSVALLHHSNLLEKTSDSPKRHNELILPMVEELLAEAQLTIQDIDVYAFGCGPGSFTGIRIAASIVQGLAFSNSKPVIPVSSLASLAQSAYSTQLYSDVVTAVDARMGEIYWAHYRLGDKKTMELLGAEVLCSPSSTPRISESTTIIPGSVLAIGSGCLYQNDIAAANPEISHWAPDIMASAKDVIQLALVCYENGDVRAAHEAIPVYLREKVNWKKLPGR